MKKPFLLLLGLSVFALFSSSLPAQELATLRYDIGSPVVQELWVNPQNGNDENDGSREKPLQSVRAAWAKIPARQELNQTGYRIMLTPGTYPEAAFPVYWEERWGTASHPVMITAAEGRGSVTATTGFNIADCHYLYISNIIFDAPGATADVLHIEKGNHFLLRNCALRAHRDNTQECLKVNQSRYVYIEDCDIQNAWDNTVDFVSVQYGHFVGNTVHESGDWTMYIKGGSAYYRIEGNEFYRGGTGGFTAGQGSGAQYLTPPWLHYEAYDVKFINNIIHDCEGAAFGVNGGYNILLAYNTAYRCGSRSHVFEAVFGSRSCDGQPGGDFDSCAHYTSYGGWANSRIADGENYTRIPNKNVYVFNNIIYNPAGYQSQYQQFNIFAPYSGEFQTGSNVPVPTNSDENLVIKGNIIWNGSPQHPLGVGGDDNGCRDNNPTCNEAQLRKDNYINTTEPRFVDAEHGNFTPVEGGTILATASAEIPAFSGNDRPERPASPAGNYANLIARDRNNTPRTSNSAPGAILKPAAVGITEFSPSPLLQILATGNVLRVEAQTQLGNNTLSIYDMCGNRVTTLFDGWADGNRQSYTLYQHLAGGMYVVLLRTTKGIVSQKFIVAE